MKANPTLKPQDIVVLLKLSLKPHRSFTYAELAAELSMSASEIFDALKRAQRSGLIDERKRKVFRHALADFLVHGLRYVFPAVPGRRTRGMATAHSAEPLSKYIHSSDEGYVWPDPQGTASGLEICPLYRSVPKAAKRDSGLHEILSLIDAIRVGRARERVFAIKEIRSRLADSAL